MLNRIKKWLGLPYWVTVAVGYPAFSYVFYTIKYCRGKSKWRITTDNFFADPRTRRWPIDKDVMLYESGATRQEIFAVKQFLRRRKEHELKARK